MNDDLLDQLCMSYLGEKVKNLNILNQNGANLVYIHAQDIAKKLGLPEHVRTNITPFPASTTVVVQKDNESDEKAVVEKSAISLTRRILPWVLSGALGVGAGVGGMALQPDKNTEPPTPVVAPMDDEINPNVGLSIK